MTADLHDLHWTMRELMMLDTEYLITQDERVIEFYTKNDIKAEYHKNKPIAERPAN